MNKIKKNIFCNKSGNKYENSEKLETKKKKQTISQIKYNFEIQKEK